LLTKWTEVLQVVELKELRRKQIRPAGLLEHHKIAFLGAFSLEINVFSAQAVSYQWQYTNDNSYSCDQGK